MEEKRYEGSWCRVESRAGQDCGRKMWTWVRHWVARLRREAFVLVVSVVWSGSADVRSWSRIVARRGTLKWWSGSKRMTAAEWPPRLVDLNVGGRMA